MTRFKKTISIILSAAILTLLFTGIASAETNPAAAPADINTIAKALNRLNILQGDNGDYKLGNMISRAEAATLIIRMLGKEDYVRQNEAQLKYVKYADVTANIWYAPYVGYCTLNNIMGGYPDGRFAPTEFTTEKQFLKMALCALGYEYNTDFDWSNVYQKAYAEGIVTGDSYASRTEDDTNYLRAAAATVVYRALNTFKKGTRTKMVYTLEDEGLFTAAEISASGILDGGGETVIEKVTALSPGSIEVKLSESIAGVKAEDITITDAAAKGTGALTVQTLAFRDDVVQIMTSGQVPGREYIISIKSVTDEAGNVSGMLTGIFKGFTPQQISSDFFRINKVEQISPNVLNVYFTHPVNENSETASYYELIKSGAVVLGGTSQNMTVKKLQSVDNAVSIFFTNQSLAPGEAYNLRISGKMTSSYGVKLGEGYGDMMSFSTGAAEASELTVASVMAWTSTSVRILFNRDVDTVWAGKKLNYTVNDVIYDYQIAVTNAVVGGSGANTGREVILSLDIPLDRSRQYDVLIDFIPDIYKQSSIENKAFKFSGNYPVNTELALTKAVSEYNNCVVLTFNKALDRTAAENASNYIIRGTSDGTFNAMPKTSYYVEQNGVCRVKLFMPAGVTFGSSQKYSVTATGLKDLVGTGQTYVFEEEFRGGGSSVVKPQMIDAVTVSSNVVKVLFNIEIAFNENNMRLSNYTAEYTANGETIKVVPVGVTYVNPTTLVLRFDDLDMAKSWQLRFGAVTDYSGVYTRTASDGGNTIAIRFGK